MQYTGIYTDVDGESYFENLGVEFQEVTFAPPAPPLNLSSFTPATRYGFVSIPAGWFGDWHPTPKRQVFFYLSGEVEVGVSDGEVRRFGPGSVLLLEDTTGKGHTARVVSTDDLLIAVVQLPD